MHSYLLALLVAAAAALTQCAQARYYGGGGGGGGGRTFRLGSSWPASDLSSWPAGARDADSRLGLSDLPGVSEAPEPAGRPGGWIYSSASYPSVDGHDGRWLPDPDDNNNWYPNIVPGPNPWDYPSIDPARRPQPRPSPNWPIYPENRWRYPHVRPHGYSRASQSDPMLGLAPAPAQQGPAAGGPPPPVAGPGAPLDAGALDYEGDSRSAIGDWIGGWAGKSVGKVFDSVTDIGKNIIGAVVPGSKVVMEAAATLGNTATVALGGANASSLAPEGGAAEGAAHEAAGRSAAFVDPGHAGKSPYVQIQVNPNGPMTSAMGVAAASAAQQAASSMGHGPDCPYLKDREEMLSLKRTLARAIRRLRRARKAAAAAGQTTPAPSTKHEGGGSSSQPSTDRPEPPVRKSHSYADK